MQSSLLTRQQAQDLNAQNRTLLQLMQAKVKKLSTPGGAITEAERQCLKALTPVLGGNTINLLNFLPESSKKAAWVDGKRDQNSVFGPNIADVTVHMCASAGDGKFDVSTEVETLKIAMGGLNMNPWPTAVHAKDLRLNINGREESLGGLENCAYLAGVLWREADNARKKCPDYVKPTDDERLVQQREIQCHLEPQVDELMKTGVLAVYFKVFVSLMPPWPVLQGVTQRSYGGKSLRLDVVDGKVNAAVFDPTRDKRQEPYGAVVEKDGQWSDHLFRYTPTKACLGMSASAIKDQQKESMDNGTSGEQTESLCMVCTAETATHTFIPCGHKCVCATCADVYNRVCNVPRGNSRKCPLCRERFTKILKIFEAGIENDSPADACKQTHEQAIFQGVPLRGFHDACKEHDWHVNTTSTVSLNVILRDGPVAAEPKGFRSPGMGSARAGAGKAPKVFYTNAKLNEKANAPVPAVQKFDPIKGFALQGTGTINVGEVFVVEPPTDGVFTDEYVLMVLTQVLLHMHQMQKVVQDCVGAKPVWIHENTPLLAQKASDASWDGSNSDQFRIPSGTAVAPGMDDNILAAMRTILTKEGPVPCFTIECTTQKERVLDSKCVDMSKIDEGLVHVSGIAPGDHFTPTIRNNSGGKIVFRAGYKEKDTAKCTWEDPVTLESMQAWTFAFPLQNKDPNLKLYTYQIVWEIVPNVIETAQGPVMQKNTVIMTFSNGGDDDSVSAELARERHAKAALARLDHGLGGADSAKPGKRKCEWTGDGSAAKPMMLED